MDAGEYAPMPPVFGAGVAVTDPLVVLRRGEGAGARAVAEREERGFLALQHRFENHAGAGGPERAAEDALQSCFRLGHRRGDGHALAGGETVRLDDDRRADLAEVGHRLGKRVAAPVGGRRDAVAGAKILGEAFRPFEPRGCRGRAERTDAGRRQSIDEATDQRRLRPDDNEVDRLRAAGVDDGLVVVDVEREARRHLGDAGVAGRGEQATQQRARGERHRHGVFATARPE